MSELDDYKNVNQLFDNAFQKKVTTPMMQNEHVRYEWQMLQACYYTLKKLRGGMAIPAMIPGGEGPNGTFFFNMLHEDFCLHARNLLQWYYAGGLVMPQEISFIKQKINEQVVTLIPDFRTSKAEEKIGDEDRRILYEHIKEIMDEVQKQECKCGHT